MEKYDIVVVGAGPGGYVAAIRAAGLGLRTAVVERNELGGICLNWGCIPTKALLRSSAAYSDALRGGEFGFEAVAPKPDLARMVQRSREVSATMNAGIAYLFKKHGITLVKGSAYLLGDGKLSVEDDSGEKSHLYGTNIILATGARPVSLPFAPIDGEKIISYYQALTPDTIPSSLAIIGSGAIGSEFAWFYRSLGTEVTIIEFQDRILPLEDDEVSAQISRSFRKAGIKVMVSSEVKAVEKGEKCILTVATKKGEEKIEAERVLSAVGVRPNTEFLGLEELGVNMERGKITVDKNYRTNVPGLYAIGDIIPTQALAHVASAEGICCVEGIAGLNPEPLDYGNIPACTYITPEVASVGLTERKVREAGIEYKVGKFPFTASGKATAAGEREGFIKLIVDAASDEILGAHFVGAHVSEMIGGMVVARRLKARASDVMKSIFPHPSMSEAIMEAAAALHGEAIHI